MCYPVGDTSIALSPGFQAYFKYMVAQGWSILQGDSRNGFCSYRSKQGEIDCLVSGMTNTQLYLHIIFLYWFVSRSHQIHAGLRQKNQNYIVYLIFIPTQSDEQKRGMAHIQLIGVWINFLPKQKRIVLSLPPPPLPYWQN